MKDGGNDENATRSADQRKQLDGGSSTPQKRWKQPKGEDRTEEKVHGKIQRKVRYLLWDRAQIEDKDATEGWISAADAARITDENVGTEDRKRASGGVFVAVDSNLGKVVGEKEGSVASIPGNEGRITHSWVNVRGGMRVFSVHLWQSEGQIPRNEALLEAVIKRARVTRHRGWWHVTQTSAQKILR